MASPVIEEEVADGLTMESSNQRSEMATHLDACAQSELIPTEE